MYYLCKVRQTMGNGQCLCLLHSESGRKYSVLKASQTFIRNNSFIVAFQLFSVSCFFATDHSKAKLDPHEEDFYFINVKNLIGICWVTMQ